MIKYLTLEEVLYLHDYAIHRYGGSYGIANMGQLQSTLNAPKQTMFGEELYRTSLRRRRFSSIRWSKITLSLMGTSEPLSMPCSGFWK